MHSTATGGDPEPAGYTGLYRALLVQNPASTGELLGLGDFSTGKAAARGMLGRPDEDQVQALRYALAVIDASNRLRRHPKVVERLSDGIGKLPELTEPDTAVIPGWEMPWEQIADLYVGTLGSLDSRIQVTGNASILQRPDVASKIRSLLLMGVRFAWLWRQLGGRRWHLLTHRNKIRSTIDSLEF